MIEHLVRTPQKHATPPASGAADGCPAFASVGTLAATRFASFDPLAAMARDEAKRREQAQKREAEQ